jgi:hypothetical protein
VRSWTRVVAVALPGLVLAGFGLAHPSYLDPTTARAWWTLHIWLIPAFPLISAAIWVLVRGQRGPLAWLARIGAYAFAAFYTGLDVLAGIGAGLVTDVQQGGSPAVARLFEIGDLLGAVGVWSLLVSAVAVGVLSIRRNGLRAAPGTLLLAGSCFPFLTDHIFHPRGVLAMLGIAAGCALLAAADRSTDPAARPAPVSPPVARR